MKFAVFTVMACALCAAFACSEDGVTPNCPALPLYQTGPGAPSTPDAATSTSPEVQQELAAAVKAGCATAPLAIEQNAGTGGNFAGATGNAGGSNTADSAGAAGNH